MKVKCDYCGNMVDETYDTCPQCGAPMSGVNRMAAQEPRTIVELKNWYADHNLPPENVTRFFIGKDIKEPRAFGIYRDDNGDFVVYKNKASGERAVRYRGSDEAYAVNELYQRLRSEIVNQKSRNAGTRSGGGGSKKRSSGIGCLGLGCSFYILGATILFILLSVGYFLLFDKTPASGYYRYDGKDYYYQNFTWYYYDDQYDDWFVDKDTGIGDIINSDSMNEYSISSHNGKSFEDSDWYVESTGRRSDDYDSGNDGWDNNYDWDDGDSWDAGGMDWDSDW